MPIFEFECKNCYESFEELVLSSNSIFEVKCPDCGSLQVRKKISSFASKISGTSQSMSVSPSSASCNPGST